jgi:hypothetical protein
MILLPLGENFAPSGALFKSLGVIYCSPLGSKFVLRGELKNRPLCHDHPEPADIIVLHCPKKTIAQEAKICPIKKLYNYLLAGKILLKNVC